MYKKNFKRNNFRDKTTIQGPIDAGMPVNDTTDKASTLLVAKTSAGLPLTGSYLTVKADPYAAVLPGSDPYAVLNRPNPRVGGAYGGRENLDGGSIRQILTSNESNFLNCFDSFMLRPVINYRYLPISKKMQTGLNADRGSGYVDEMIRAIDEVISVAKSTTYTNLAINNYYIKSDLAFPLFKEGDGVQIGADQYFSCGNSKGLYIILICYQIWLQNFAAPFNAFNKFRANQGTMINMSWNRETPKLNDYFGVMNKNAFVNQWKSVSYVLNGEYFDIDWMRQFNLIGSLVSRKSNAMTDPLLELSCTHALPNFEFGTISEGAFTKIFSTEDINKLIKATDDPTLKQVDNMQDATALVMNMLSINDTLTWARQNPLTGDAVGRMNTISSYLTIVTMAANLFKTSMGDLRTMLDVLQRVGINQWSKSTTLEIFPIVKVDPQNNLTVNDLFTTLLSGSNTYSWNKDTYRWTIYTLWDTYLGIPEYDHKSGGAFLTFSNKTLAIPDSYTDNDKAALNNALKYLPVLIAGFYQSAVSVAGFRNGYIYVTNRFGNSYELTFRLATLGANANLARLAPLTSDSNVQIRVPCIATDTSELTLSELSFLSSACLKVFGCFAFGNQDDPIASTDLAVNPNSLGYIPVEIEDLQSEMITYARTKGPFVVNAGLKTELGFIGLS